MLLCHLLACWASWHSALHDAHARARRCVICYLCNAVARIWGFLQELGDTTPFVNSNEPGLKRRCIVMLELSATLARVLEFLTSRLPDVFLAGPPLNLSR